MQGHETPTDEASPYGNPDEGDLGPQSMQDTSRLSDFASEAASQSSQQGEALGASGSLHSQKSGDNCTPGLCLCTRESLVKLYRAAGKC